MPNIKSAKKRVKVTAVKTANNKAFKSALKTILKKASSAIEDNSADKEQAVRLAYKKLDQACAKNIMHKNKAARYKSALACKLNKA